MRKYLLIASVVAILLGYHEVQAANFLSNGLIGYWTFDSKDTNWNTNTTNDVSGSGYTGTLTNMSQAVSNVVGKIGQGLRFDGVNNYVSVPHNASLTPTGDYTITAWVKTSSTASEQSVVTKFDASGNYPGYLCSIGQNDGVTGSTFSVSGSVYSVAFWTGEPSSNWLVSSKVVNDNVWHLVSCRLSGTTASILVDGIQIASAARTPERSNSGNFEIGRRKDVGANFPGLIDDVHFYNRALSSAEVVQLYRYSLSRRSQY